MTELAAEFRVNSHVERLRRYIPLDAGADQLVHELVDLEEATEIPTRAEDAIHAVVQQPEVTVILLTGDAGHGKTRLCYRLLESLGLEKSEAAERIQQSGDGSAPVVNLEDRRELRIVKDLSDFSPEDGADILARALSADGRVTVICANEGRLREVAGVDPHALTVVLEQIAEGLRTGSGSSEHGVFVLNLNAQSVAAEDGALVSQLLDRWVADGRRWSVCAACAAEPLCPIRENRRLLAEDERAEIRREKFGELLRIAERTGTIVTIRELLVTIAFALTRGLRCSDVHTRVQQGPVDRQWQWEYLFHEAIFGRMGLLRKSSPGLRAPAAMSRIDPGNHADRRIDETLDADGGGHHFRPYDPTVDTTGIEWRDQPPYQVRADQLRLTRFLRRRAFFDEESSRGAAMVGLRWATEFAFVASGQEEDHSRIRGIRDRLVKGLSAVQGLVVGADNPQVLPIVEPALAGRRGGGIDTRPRRPAREGRGDQSIRLVGATAWTPA